MRSIKVRAAQQDATLTETITTLLRSSLSEASRPTMTRAQFPLVLGSRQATPDELSADRVAKLDASHEVAATDLSG